MIICCGEALIDFLPRKSAEVRMSTSLSTAARFSTRRLRSAVWASRPGYFGGLSKDFFGDMLAEGLKASHVDLKFVKVGPAVDTGLREAHRWPCPLLLLRREFRGPHAHKKDLPKLCQGKALHFGSISLIPDPGGGTLEALLRAASKTRVISLDPNIRPGHQGPQGHLARLNRLIARADILKISDEDVAWIPARRTSPEPPRNG